MVPLTICAVLALAAPGAQGPSAGSPTPNDRAIRVAFRAAERVIDGRIQQMTAHAPFALLGTTRGAYLAGYGAVFTLEVNLNPVANISPFRPPYSAKEIQELNRRKREKLAVLKSGLRELLVEQAAALVQVAAQERIAVVVNLFSFNWEDTTGLPSQIVAQATRQVLLDAQARRAGPELLERLLEMREF